MPRALHRRGSDRPTCGCCKAPVDVRDSVICRRGCNPEADGCHVCGHRACNVHGCYCRKPGGGPKQPRVQTTVFWGAIGVTAS